MPDGKPYLFDCTFRQLTTTLHIEPLKETREVELSRDVVVGRGPQADVQLNDLTLARTHLRFFEREGSWWVADLDSPAGTWLDGQQLRAPQPIAAGQVIRAGGTLIRIA